MSTVTMALDVNMYEIPKDTELANVHAWFYSTTMVFSTF